MKRIVNTWFLIVFITLLVVNSVFASDKINLAVGIAASSAPGEALPVLQGFYHYMDDGQLIKKTIEITGGYAWNFRGQRIVEVSVNRVDGAGEYQLFVYENNKVVFRTDLIEDTSPVHYKFQP